MMISPTVALALAAQAAATQSDSSAVTAFLGIVLGLAVVIAVVLFGHTYWAAKKSRGELTDSNDVVRRIERP